MYPQKPLAEGQNKSPQADRHMETNDHTVATSLREGHPRRMPLDGASSRRDSTHEGGCSRKQAGPFAHVPVPDGVVSESESEKEGEGEGSPHR